MRHIDNSYLEPGQVMRVFEMVVNFIFKFYF
jgi:hypothetical protein